MSALLDDVNVRVRLDSDGYHATVEIEGFDGDAVVVARLNAWPASDEGATHAELERVEVGAHGPVAADAACRAELEPLLLAHARLAVERVVAANRRAA